MTLYRESLKRFFRLGITLLAIVVIVSTVMAVQICTTEVESDMTLTSVYGFDQCLLAFMYIGGLGFAFLGFSFLTRRADSDFYHSLPIKRTDLYLSVTMAALTWIVATVFLSILSVTIVNLAVGRSFVPMYPLMNFVYYIAGAMLVFAAAAIGMSLTGTWFSAAVVTGLVLFLPRYILFIVARTVAAKTLGLTNWVDFGLLLNPAYNAAVAPIVLLFRPTLQYNLMTFPLSFYSLALAIAELAVGAYLFVRRKSEIAEHGATSKVVQTVFACLAALPLLLLVASGRLSGTGNIAYKGIPAAAIVVLVLSICVYAGYQMIVLRNFKAMVRSLPFYLATMLVSIGVVAASAAYGSAVERFQPAADEIASVQFLVGERNEYESNSYRSLLVSELQFSDAETIAAVADSYAETRVRAVEDVNSLYYGYYGYDFAATVVPVRFNLKNGGSKVRNVLFANKTELETLRRKNPDYVAALGSFAPSESICGRMEYSGKRLTDADIEALRVSYEKEFPKDTLKVNAPVYALAILPNESVCLTDMTVQYGSFQIDGYIGTRRYVDTYIVVPVMEKTCSLWMKAVNERADEGGYEGLMELINKALSENASEWSSFSLNISAYNIPIRNNPAMFWPNMGISAYGGYCDYTPEAQAVIIEAAKLLSRGKPTNDPTAVTVCAYYDAQFDREDRIGIDSPQYLSFDAETTARITELFNEWYELLGKPEMIYRQY